LTLAKIWIQIDDLPDGFKNLVKTLSGKVGEYIAMETPSVDFIGNLYK
jgi:hypothetical protein